MNNRVFYAVLNWGLGHATRSVPVIEAVIATGADVVIASNGATKAYLKDRFPHVNMLEIPDKEIKYGSGGAGIGLLKRSFQQKKINRKQAAWMRQNVEALGITHIISDNLYGAYHPDIPSVIITHQVGILSPFFKKRFDRYMAAWLSKFDAVWIPDFSESESIAGRMLQNPFFKGKAEFIGPLSRFDKGKSAEKNIDLLAILSGPEPQRTFLERRLLKIFKKIPGNHVLVRGRMERQALEEAENVRTYAFLHEAELTDLILRAKMVVCRSGYSSILDLIRLEAKACLVPTPQQPEQKYLAKRMQEKGWFKMVAQKELRRSDLTQRYEHSPWPQENFEESLNQILKPFLDG